MTSRERYFYFVRIYWAINFYFELCSPLMNSKYERLTSAQFIFFVVYVIVVVRENALLYEHKIFKRWTRTSNSIRVIVKLIACAICLFESRIRLLCRESFYAKSRTHRFDRHHGFNFESASAFCLNANTDLILHPVCRAYLREIVRLEMSKWKLLLRYTFYEAPNPNAIVSLLEFHTQKIPKYTFHTAYRNVYATLF